MKRVVLISLDDWEGLYVDGVLVSEDHDLDNHTDWIDWVNKYQITLDNFETIYLDECPYVEDYGNLPSDINELEIV